MGVKKFLTALVRHCTLRFVMRKLTPASLRHALRIIRPPVPDIARDLGVGLAALYRYRDGSRSIPPSLRPKLAAYVERRSRELDALAKRLNP
jgi:hypothetical protein